MKLLHIDSSITGTQSVSRQLTRDIVNTWTAGHPNTTVEYLDLVENTPSHLSAESLGFRMPPASESLTDGQSRENAVSEALVTQFLAADVIVIGAPLYNFNIPSQLKSWIDRVAQAGRTFTYTANGPKGFGRWQDRDRCIYPRRRVLHQRRWPCHGTPGKLFTDRVGVHGHY